MNGDMHRRGKRQKGVDATQGHPPNDSAFTSTLDSDELWPPVEETGSRPLSEPEELHSPHAFSFLSVPARPPKWEKVLWKEQPYPDNYTDATFLQELVRRLYGQAQPCACPACSARAAAAGQRML